MDACVGFVVFDVCVVMCLYVYDVECCSVMCMYGLFSVIYAKLAYVWLVMCMVN